MGDAESWGIPTLDIERQALDLVSPVVPYGSVPRRAAMRGTFHFYVNDTRFTRLFANPDRLICTFCTRVIEPNCSTGPDIPRAVALFGIYRKRAFASFCQRFGVRVVVDLNVDDSVFDIALLGVPKGWRSYATRSHRKSGLGAIERQHALAVEHAGTSDVFFTVVGGGKPVKSACVERGWNYVPEHVRAVRGLD